MFFSKNKNFYGLDIGNYSIKLVSILFKNEKIKLIELLEKETSEMPENDKIQTHFASEKVLAKDWLLPEEDEAWKDL